MLRSIVCALVLVGLLGPAKAEHMGSGEHIRFGLTAVVVRENLRFLDQWAEYLGDKMGRPVEFIRRRSYREVMDMLDSGALDFAWICGFPYVQKREPEFLKLLAVPIYKGEPLYHSYIIVHADSPYRSLDDLRGKVFAYSDPESNSGFLYPQYLLTKRGEKSETYFHQTFFTFNHAETIEAVAEQVADGGAVDSYIWEYISATMPSITNKTRIIRRSPTFGFPPLVSRVGINEDLEEHMRAVLTEMHADPEGRPFLSGLKLDEFRVLPPALFDNIREMADRVRSVQPSLAKATKDDKGG